MENKQGYIKSAYSKSYGKYFALTNEALYYFYSDTKIPFNEINISPDNLQTDNKLYYYKVLNGFFAQTVFNDFTKVIYNRYKNTDKKYQKQYRKEQFVKQYIFPSYSETYSKTKAKIFCDNFLPEFESDISLQEQYMYFIKALKVEIQEQNSPILLFNYLKDFYNSLVSTRDEAVQITSTLLFRHATNALRKNPYSFYNLLYKKSIDSELLKTDMNIFYLTELERIYQISKRTLCRIKTNSKTESELKEISDNLDLLEKEILHVKAQKEIMATNFEFMIFDKFNTDTSVAEFIPTIITLDTLKDKKCFITDIEENDNEKPCIVFTIINHSNEEISAPALFCKLESCFRYYSQFLYMFDFRLQFVVMESNEIPIVKTKLNFIKEQLKELGNYGVLLNKLTDIKIISTREHMIERYRAFTELRDKHKTF